MSFKIPFFVIALLTIFLPDILIAGIKLIAAIGNYSILKGRVTTDQGIVQYTAVFKDGERVYGHWLEYIECINYLKPILYTLLLVVLVSRMAFAIRELTSAI